MKQSSLMPMTRRIWGSSSVNRSLNVKSMWLRFWNQCAWDTVRLIRYNGKMVCAFGSESLKIEHENHTIPQNWQAISSRDLPEVPLRKLSFPEFWAWKAISWSISLRNWKSFISSHAITFLGTLSFVHFRELYVIDFSATMCRPGITELNLSGCTGLTNWEISHVFRSCLHDGSAVSISIVYFHFFI
jgi:hypothetical protein